MFTEKARAKINLNLHVGRLVEDQFHKYFGYHPLSSLVVFADYGDALSCEVADETLLKISGPFSRGLQTDETNLILKAYKRVAAKAILPPLSFHLTKNLPLASGIGGGSADAAAALRLMKNFVDLPENTWLDIALNLGADVPVCLHSKSCVMSGIGETIEFLPGLSPLTAVLVNPGSPVSTGSVFRAFDETKPGDIKAQSSGELLDRFANSQNDLQSVAAQINPDIYICLEAFGEFPARMSGSGATCFALASDIKTARKLAKQIQSTYPHWWVEPVMLGDTL